MMEFLIEYRLLGLFIGVCTFLIIGLFHPVVVKAEYYWGTRCWWVFLLLGLGGMGRFAADRQRASGRVGGGIRLFVVMDDQGTVRAARAVAKGWFPANPKRKGKKS